MPRPLPLSSNVTDRVSIHGESFGVNPQDKSVQDESVTNDKVELVLLVHLVLLVVVFIFFHFFFQLVLLQRIVDIYVGALRMVQSSP